MSYRVVFMGSPEFAVPSLQKLAEQYPVVGVVTQPDRPAGRGRVLTPPPIKVLAQALGIPTIQPARLREPEAQAALQAWAPDLIVVTAFGQILRKSVLELPRFGCINVHASLLPRWRGAAPIQAAILHGDAQTGVTIMRLDPGVDTGPILAQQALPIHADDTTETLGNRLSQAGAELLIQTLPPYLDGHLQPQPQSDDQATYAKMLSKEEGLLDFSQPASELERRVRAFYPWPSAYLIWQGQPLKIQRAHAAACTDGEPGQHSIVDGLPAVRTPAGCLVFDELQPAGKRAMSGQDFLRGARQWTE